MVHELFYTSAERGLELGTTGFCTVARTRGLPKRLERLLHSLSVYKWDLRSGHNPVVYMHTRANLDGQSLFILSRVAPAPADYSGRSNYFAHHVVLTASELPQAGPVWVIRQPGFLEQQWDGQVKELATGRPVPQGNGQPRRCTTWERVTGDAGWAGLLLKYVSENPTAPVYLIADDVSPVLDLLDEVIALLPVEKRWQVTFTTRYIQLPGEVSCGVRVVSPNSERIAEAKASPRKVDLAALRGQKAPDDPYTKAARSGQTVSIAESQYVVAQDEPFLPPGSAAFARMSGGIPPPRASAVSVNPSSAVVPIQPPVPPPIAPRSHTPFWLVLLVLLNLVLVASVGALFVLQQRNYQRDLADLRQFDQKVEEWTKNIEGQLQDLLEQKLQSLLQALKKLDQQVAQLETKVKHLSGKIDTLTKQSSSSEDAQKKANAQFAGDLKQVKEELSKIQTQLEGLSKGIQDSRHLQLRRMTVKLELKKDKNKGNEQKQIVFSGKADDIPEAAHIYEAQLYADGEPLTDRIQQSPKIKILQEISLSRPLASLGNVTLALPSKPGEELQLRFTPLSQRNGASKEFEKFLQGLELRLVDRQGAVWLVKLECHLSEKDRKELFGQ